MKQLKTFCTQIKDVDQKGQILVAANAIGNVDSDSDRSMSGSFNKTIKDNFKRVKWFLNHDTNILLGVPIEAKEKSAYLQVLGQLNMNKSVSKDIYEDYKLYAEHGRTLEHSIGVTAKKYKQVEDVREVYEWAWWEYSTLTSWGANANTPLLGLKSADDLYEEILWQERRLEKGKYSDDKFKKIDLYLQRLKRHSLSSEPDSPQHHLPVKPNVQIKAFDRFISTLN
jgi:HK97 family phage prohead protease